MTYIVLVPIATDVLNRPIPTGTHLSELEVPAATLAKWVAAKMIRPVDQPEPETPETKEK